jgi:hypothetical protein
MIGTYRLCGRASLRLDAESVRHHSPGSAKRRSREAPPWVLIPIRDFDPEGVAQRFVEPLQGSLPALALSTARPWALLWNRFAVHAVLPSSSVSPSRKRVTDTNTLL